VKFCVNPWIGEIRGHPRIVGICVNPRIGEIRGMC
jgi:hypothetical protein